MGSQSPLPVILTMRQSVCHGAGFDKLAVTCLGEFEESEVHWGTQSGGNKATNWARG